jgi:hypothetical protein
MTRTDALDDRFDEAVRTLLDAHSAGVDVGKWLARLAGAAAADLGSTEELLANRPGSWEAGEHPAHHRRGLRARVGRRHRQPAEEVVEPGGLCQPQRRNQTRSRHQVRIIEDRPDRVRRFHLRGAPLGQFGSDVAIQILPAQEGILVLRHAQPPSRTSGSGLSAQGAPSARPGRLRPAAERAARRVAATRKRSLAGARISSRGTRHSGDKPAPRHDSALSGARIQWRLRMVRGTLSG